MQVMASGFALKFRSVLSFCILIPLTRNGRRLKRRQAHSRRCGNFLPPTGNSTFFSFLFCCAFPLLHN